MSISQNNEMNRIRAAFEAARAAKQAGDAPKALQEWQRVLDLTLHATEREPRQARMASSSESAIVYQELGDLRTSETLLTQAVELAEQLAKESASAKPEERVADALALASVHVNLAGLYITAREPKRGLPHAQHCLNALNHVGEHPARNMLAFAGTLQRGTAHLLMASFHEAENDLAQAIDHGNALVTDGQLQVLPQLVESAGRYFAAAKAQERANHAIERVEHVARIATAAFEAQGAPALQIFVNAQMHRINALLECARYDEAEDQLWHMIDGSGRGDILLSAPDFYAALWQRTDEALNQGGLPRHEILESWEDVIEQAAQREGDPIAIDTMRQRLRLHTERAIEDTKAFLANHAHHTKPLGPVASALIQALQKEFQNFE